MFLGFIRLTVLCLIVNSALAQKQLLTQFSLAEPFIVGHGTSPTWNYSGSSVIGDRYVRLTPDAPAATGRLWHGQALMTPEWEITFDLKVGGKTQGADGIAFWYTNEPIKTDGKVYGAPSRWRGLMVGLDTFDNVGKGRSHPKLYGMMNDGTFEYAQETEGRGIVSKSCKFELRNQGNPSRIGVSYSSAERKLVVSKAINSKGSMSVCFTMENIDLPIGYYISFSAATGEFSDNHDIYGVQVYQTTSTGTAQHRQTVTTQPQPSSQPQNQNQQKQNTQKNTQQNDQQTQNEEQTPKRKTHEQKVLPTLTNSDHDKLLKVIDLRRNQIFTAFDAIQEADDIFESIVLRLAANPPGEYSSEFTEVNEILKRLETTLKSIPQNKQAEDLKSINANIGNVQTHLEKTVVILEALVVKLKQATASTVDIIASKASRGFWIFFIIIQIAFGAGLYFWKAMTDEKKKQF